MKKKTLIAGTVAVGSQIGISLSMPAFAAEANFAQTDPRRAEIEERQARKILIELANKARGMSSDEEGKDLKLEKLDRIRVRRDFERARGPLNKR